MKRRKKLHPAWWMLAGCILLQAGATGILANCQSVFYSSISGELGISNGAMSLFSTMHTCAIALAAFALPTLYRKVKLRVLLTALSLLACGFFMAESLFSDILHWYLIAIPFGLVCGGLVTAPATLVINN